MPSQPFLEFDAKQTARLREILGIGEGGTLPTTDEFLNTLGRWRDAFNAANAAAVAAAMGGASALMSGGNPLVANAEKRAKRHEEAVAARGW